MPLSRVAIYRWLTWLVKIQFEKIDFSSRRDCAVFDLSQTWKFEKWANIALKNLEFNDERQSFFSSQFIKTQEYRSREKLTLTSFVSRNEQSADKQFSLQAWKTGKEKINFVQLREREKRTLQLWIQRSSSSREEFTRARIAVKIPRKPFKTNDTPTNAALYRKRNTRWHSSETNHPADRILPMEINASLRQKVGCLIRFHERRQPILVYVFEIILERASSVWQT